MHHRADIWARIFGPIPQTLKILTRRALTDEIKYKARDDAVIDKLDKAIESAEKLVEEAQDVEILLKKVRRHILDIDEIEKKNA